MRKFYFLVLISIFCFNGFGQTISLPTVREIYDFAVGDTFEYYTNNGYELHDLYVIQQRIDYGDSIIYTVKNVDQSPLPVGTTITIRTLTWFIWNPDSVFYYNLDICDTCLDSLTYSFSTNDTVYTVYEHYTIQVYDDGIDEWVPQGHRERISYQKGLGVIDDRDDYQGVWQMDNIGVYEKTLIYYHKMNGSTMGTYYLISGLEDNIAVINAGIFPNPATSDFQLKLSETPPKGTVFKLYDALGRKTKEQSINEISNNIIRGNLSNGIYFWQLESESGVISKGKLVFE